MGRPHAYVSDDFDDEPISLPVVEIDPRGDLFVLVAQTQQQLVQISGNALAMISETFQQMLSRQQSGKTASYTMNTPLCLPDDDPSAMKILFRLAHCQYTEPAEIPTHCLPAVLKVCDKYGCLERFKFWLRAVREGWYSNVFDRKWATCCNSTHLGKADLESTMDHDLSCILSASVRSK